MRDTVGPGVSGPALLLTTDKISASHRSRDAYVYVFSELRARRITLLPSGFRVDMAGCEAEVINQVVGMEGGMDTAA